MIDSIPGNEDAFDTLPNPHSIEDTDPGFTTLLPDTGALLAAVGMPGHAIREVLASRGRTGADG